MRLTRQSRSSDRPELNIASTIDVVFLLLIFFMCTSSFRSDEDELRTQFPRGSQAATSEEQEQEQDFQPVRIRLAAAGESVVIEIDGQSCGSFAVLAERLGARRAIADVPVVIEGQRAVPFGHMVAALDACQQASLQRVAFSTKGTR